uniref:Crinkler effector protein N-terminal domain-containing protein n=1 Tax=Peronospora matthiolae TaxID=2874970 RepID=A0AAV1UA92_9STRA
MVQVTLCCAFVGRTRSVSVVDIYTGRSVAHLKEAIKEENQVKVKCDASDLQLFLAKRDGAWLVYDDSFKHLMQTKRFLGEMKKMRALWQLMDPSLFGSGASPGENVIHVLVVVPPTAPSQLDVSGVTILVTKSMELNNSPLVAFWNACRKISTDRG